MTQIKARVADSTFNMPKLECLRWQLAGHLHRSEAHQPSRFRGADALMRDNCVLKVCL